MKEGRAISFSSLKSGLTHSVTRLKSDDVFLARSIVLFGLVIALAVIMVLDAALPSYHILIKVLKKACVYSVVAASMCLLNGFTGLFSLGQAGFMLLGAYGYAILCIPVAKRAGVYQYFNGGIVQFSLPEFFSRFLGTSLGTGVGMIVAILIGGVIAALFAALIGLPVLSLKSDYLAIATLGFAEVIRAFFQWNKLGPLTNGSNILKGFPEFKRATSYFLLMCLFIGLIVLLVNSTYGRAFKAIRDDEVASQAMGINLAKHKRLAFVISSFFAGIGGAMLAMYMASVQALSFKSAMTYEILLIVVMGGIGSISGSVITSFVYVISVEWLLRGLDSGTFLGISAPGIFRNGFRMAVVSLVIMTVVLLFNRGVMGDKEFDELNLKLIRKIKATNVAKRQKGEAK